MPIEAVCFTCWACEHHAVAVGQAVEQTRDVRLPSQSLIAADVQAAGQGLRIDIGLTHFAAQRQAPWIECGHALQIEWAACFRACARLVVATKRLHAHHRTNNIAVHIHIARLDAAGDVFDLPINAAVYAVG